METRRSLGVVLVAAVMALAWVESADAQVSMMRRGAENIVMAPVDLVLAPVVVVNMLKKGVGEAEMEPVLAGATYGAGAVFLSIFQLGVVGFRLAAGVIELPGGLLLWPVNGATGFETPALFDIQNVDAIIRRETPNFDFVGGGYYLWGR